LGITILLLCHALPASYTQGAGTSLRFYGNGVNDIDRVKIPIDGPEVPADVGATDFTIEWWMKASLGENSSGSCIPGGDNWITGNTIFDRDIWGAGDYGDYGISLANGRIAFGAHNGSDGHTLCGSRLVADGAWHHVAVARQRSDGSMRIYVDGQLDAQASGPAGDISYRDGRQTGYANDPYLVVGAEKHDAGSAYPSYSGWVDEIRISNVLRYAGGYAVPSVPFTPDANTVALYHLDEGSGNVVGDVSGAVGGPSNGDRRYGGQPAGPEWSADTPFSSSPPTSTPTGTATPIPAPVILGTPDAGPLASLAVIRWRTNVVSDGQVRFGSECDTWTRSVSDPYPVTSHHLALTGLTANADYCYQVRSSNASGTTPWTSSQWFTTLASESHLYLPVCYRESSRLLALTP
jgi:hypothetical protein